jgi:hypothetical protein
MMMIMMMMMMMMMMMNFWFYKDDLFWPDYLPTHQGRKLLSQDVNFMLSHLTTSIQSTIYTESNGGFTVHDGLERMWNEAAETYFKILSLHFRAERPFSWGQLTARPRLPANNKQDCGKSLWFWRYQSDPTDSDIDKTSVSIQLHRPTKIKRIIE